MHIPTQAARAVAGRRTKWTRPAVLTDHHGQYRICHVDALSLVRALVRISAPPQVIPEPGQMVTLSFSGDGRHLIHVRGEIERSVDHGIISIRFQDLTTDQEVAVAELVLAQMEDQFDEWMIESGHNAGKQRQVRRYAGA